MADTSLAPGRAAAPPATPADDAAAGAIRPGVWQRFGPDVVGGAVAVAITIVAAIVILQLWQMSPRVPIGLGGDVFLSMVGVKNTALEGWYSHTPLMGAPYGQNLLDFPAAGDLANLLLIRGLTLFSRDAGLVLNAFWLLTFPLVTLSAYVAGRGLRLSRPFSVVVGVLYAFLPYHFIRGEAHLLLSAYFAAPLVCMLAVRQLTADPLIVARSGEATWRERLLHPGNVIGLAILVLGATTGLYYAVFTALLVGAAAVLRLVITRRWSDALLGAASVAVVVVVLGLQLIPSMLHVRANGFDPQAVQRSLAEVEMYSLKLSNLFLPVGGHRFGFLADLKQTADTSQMRSENTEMLGLFGVAGFLVLLAVALTGLVRGARRGRGASVLYPMAALTLVCVLVGMIGGFPTLLAVVGFDEIRAWNRISVFIAFFSLAAAAVVVDQLVLPRLRTRRVSLSAWRAGVAAALVVLALLDQTAHFVPPYRQQAAEWQSDRAFVKGIEATVGGSASIFQLPIMPFPEAAAPYDLDSYDLATGYLHSDTLAWSYGGMKGRESDWQQKLLGQSVPELLRSVAVAGFDGLYVDRRGIGPSRAGLEAGIEEVVGPPALTSYNGNLIFYDLRAFRQSVLDDLGPEADAARTELITPPPLRPGRGLKWVEYLDDRVGVFVTPKATWYLENPSDRPVTYRISASFRSATGNDRSVTVTGPSGTTELTIAPTAAEQSFEVVAPPGRSELVFAVTDTGPNVGDLAFRMEGWSAEPLPG